MFLIQTLDIAEDACSLCGPHPFFQSTLKSLALFLILLLPPNLLLKSCLLEAYIQVGIK